MLERLVDATLADPLAAARDHAARGGRVIGYATCGVPVEIIEGAGAFPLHLPWNVDAPTPRADRYMESLFERGLRSAFDRWLAGDFAFLDAVVLPRTHDTAQRIYYYADELLRTGELSGPRPLLFDLQKIPRESSVRYGVAAARRLCAELGVNEALLPPAIERANRRRAAFAMLAERTARGEFHAAWTARVLRAALHADPRTFDDALADALAVPSQPERISPRILLAGSVPPDERLHRAIDAGGGVLAAEATLFGAARHGRAIEPPTVAAGAPVPDAIERVVRAYHAGVPSIRDFAPWIGDALDAVEGRADGIVLWLVEEDEGLVWQVPKLLARAREASVPVLELQRQEWGASADTTARIAAFVRGVSRR